MQVCIETTSINDNYLLAHPRAKVIFNQPNEPIVNRFRSIDFQTRNHIRIDKKQKQKNPFFTRLVVSLIKQVKNAHQTYKHLHTQTVKKRAL